MADEGLSLSLIGGQARVPHRWCRRCGESKPLTDFEKRSATRYRLVCKKCHNDRIDAEDNRRRASEWAKANPEKHNAAGRRNYERRRGDVTRWIASSLRTTRAACKKRGTECTLTAEQVAGLYEDQGHLCALTGRELIFGSRGQQRDSLSMDRIEAGGGYTLDNVRLVTYQANMARGQFSDDELDAFCEVRLAWKDSESRVREAAQ